MIVQIEIPDTISVTLRGHVRDLDTTKLPPAVITYLMEKGIQRAANDPLGGLYPKGHTPGDDEINTYWTELTSRWYGGEVAKARKPGAGRTADPVLREVKRLANAEVDASLTKLLIHHGAGGVPMAKKEFDEKLRAKYVEGQVARHKERLEREAKANLAKLAKASEVELLEV